MKPWSRQILAVASFAVVMMLSGAYPAASQLIPGKLPEGPPPAPGQVTGDPKKATTAPAPVGADAQKVTVTPVEPQEGAKFVEKVQTVLVPTSVLDPDGHGYVNGLLASDFEVLDNDKPQRVVAEITEQPLSVVLVLQANADIEPMLPKIKKSGILLHGLVTGVDGDLAILTFDHEMHHTLDFTSDPDKIDDAMQKIHAGSSVAAVIDAVADADHMLERHDPTNKRRRVIILMSRNVDNGSQMHLAEVVRQMQFHGIEVYSVNISKFLTTLMKKEEYPRSPNGNIPAEGMPPLPGGNVRTQTTDIQQGLGTNALNAVPMVYRSIRDIFKKTPAEALTTLTGGNTYSFATQRGLEQAITDIGKDLNSQYILSYTPTEAVKEEPGYHSIRVLVNRPGLIIRTRAGYWWGGGQMQ
jgi:VWFA-related protein